MPPRVAAWTLGQVEHPITLFQDGRFVLPDGDLIRIYDPKTGEWAEIDTGGEG